MSIKQWQKAILEKTGAFKEGDKIWIDRRGKGNTLKILSEYRSVKTHEELQKTERQLSTKHNLSIIDDPMNNNIE